MSELSFSQKKTPKTPRELGYGLNDTAGLRKLILENPELPLVVFAGHEACAYDWSSMLCTDVRAYIGEFLDCEQEINEERVYDDRETFEDDLWSYYEFTDEVENMTDDEYKEFIAEKMKEYEPYWKKCILLYVDN